MTDTTSEQNDLPFVSVIVPVYNDSKLIRTCIEALLAQTYPHDHYEILVVDNGSTDVTRDVVGLYPVTLLVEDTIQSSYAARNKGLQHARGDIIALTDSDCTPVPSWIEEGVHALKVHAADMAGGNVRFLYSPRLTGAEIYDLLIHMNTERYIRERSCAVTANLFVRKSVFDAFGPFPSAMKSGADMFWTRRAATQGYKLVYAPHAEVMHPTRQLGELLKKQYRVGKGQRDIRAEERAARPQLEKKQSKARTTSPAIVRKISGTLKGLAPLPVSFIRQSMQQRQLNVSFVRVWRVWLVMCLCHTTKMLGSWSQSVSRRVASQRSKSMT